MSLELDAIKEISFKYIGSLLPLLRKKIYSQDEFKKDFKIDVKNGNPTRFVINCDIPHVAIYFEIDNKSQYLEIIIEKLFFEICINSNKGSQPVIYQGKMLVHERIKKKEAKMLYWTTELNFFQTEFLKAIKDSKELSATFHINYEVSSKIHNISGEINLDNRPCKIEGR